MVEIHVEAPGFNAASVERLAAAARSVCLEADAEGEVSVALLGDPAITELNRDYLGKDRPTDVISFSLGGDGPLMADVYVGIDQARRQAAEHGVDLQEELVRLVIHGTLHAVGYDHPDGEERLQSPMFLLQERLVQSVLDLDPPGGPR